MVKGNFIDIYWTITELKCYSNKGNISFQLFVVCSYIYSCSFLWAGIIGSVGVLFWSYYFVPMVRDSSHLLFRKFNLIQEVSRKQWLRSWASESNRSRDLWVLPGKLLWANILNSELYFPNSPAIYAFFFFFLLIPFELSTFLETEKYIYYYVLVSQMTLNLDLLENMIKYLYKLSITLPIKMNSTYFIAILPGNFLFL